MKKILTSFIGILCFVSFANGQQRGDSYINGIVGVNTGSTSVIYGSRSESTPSATTFLIGAGYAFFPADHFRIELDATYELQSSSNEDYKQNTGVITIGPSFAYYVPITSTFYYTPQFDVAAALGSFGDNSAIPQSIDCTGVAFEISPVKFEFRPTDHFGLDVNIMSLTYVHMKYKDYDLASNALDFSLCIRPSVGFKYYF